MANYLKNNFNVLSEANWSKWGRQPKTKRSIKFEEEALSLMLDFQLS